MPVTFQLPLIDVAYTIFYEVSSTDLYTFHCRVINAVGFYKWPDDETVDLRSDNNRLATEIREWVRDNVSRYEVE